MGDGEVFPSKSGDNKIEDDVGDGEVFPSKSGDNKKIEDEIHFLCTCTVYDNMKVNLYRRPCLD